VCHHFPHRLAAQAVGLQRLPSAAWSVLGWRINFALKPGRLSPSLWPYFRSRPRPPLAPVCRGSGRPVRSTSRCGRVTAFSPAGHIADQTKIEPSIAGSVAVRWQTFAGNSRVKARVLGGPSAPASGNTRFRSKLSTRPTLPRLQTYRPCRSVPLKTGAGGVGELGENDAVLIGQAVWQVWARGK